MNKREFIKFAALLSSSGLTRAATAQTSATMRLLVSSSPGGQTDAFARALAEGIRTRTGRVVIVENRNGGGGTVAAQALLAAPPDGSTLLLATLGHIVTPLLQHRPTYNPIGEFSPVAMVGESGTLLLVRQDLHLKNLREFVAYAKANPRKLVYGSAGIGSPQHLTMERMRLGLGIDLLHVPYRGASPALMALRSGEIQVMLGEQTYGQLVQHDGTAVAIAQASLQSVPGFEGIDRVSDLIPGFDAPFWMGIVASKATPEAQREKLNRSINDIATSDMQDLLAKSGFRHQNESIEQFGAFYHREYTVWSALIKSQGIVAE